MASHWTYIAGAFGMACVAVVVELVALARRRRRIERAARWGHTP